MSAVAWKLPWRDQWVPHALLDINRGCNIACRACYNTAADRAKPLPEIEREIRELLQLRRLDSLAIVGGEPTLHPQLPEIIRMVKAAGLHVELFTNGLLLDSPMLSQLKGAGTDMVFLHIDAQQRRPDLTDPGQLNTLRVSKAAAVVAAGMEAGIAITAYENGLPEIDSAVEFVLSSPHADYLLVTHCRQTQQLGQLEGDLVQGLRGTRQPTADDHPLDNRLIHQHMQERHGMLPFACIGSNRDADDPRWLSYMVGVCIDSGRRTAMRVSAAEWLFLAVHRRLRGRYPFYMRQSPPRFRLQLFLNALLGGRMAAGLGLLGSSFGRNLRAKRLLFQCPAELTSDGTLIHCAHCPDATLVGGKLVPVCVCDQVGRGYAP